MPTVVPASASNPQYHHPAESALVDTTAFATQRTHATLTDFVTTSALFHLLHLSHSFRAQCSLSNPCCPHCSASKTPRRSNRHCPSWCCAPCRRPHPCSQASQRRIRRRNRQGVLSCSGSCSHRRSFAWRPWAAEKVN